MEFTTYKTGRNHDNFTCLFIVNVPEAKQKGLGFQINLWGTTYGLSITWISTK